MPKFSDTQLTSIAQQFHDLSVAIGQFRLNQIHSGLSLDDPGIVQLLGSQISLLNVSSSFYLEAAAVDLTDADAAATKVTAATTSANKAVKRLGDVNRVVTIASSVGVLAAAVMTGDLGQIGSAARDVVDASMAK